MRGDRSWLPSDVYSFGIVERLSHEVDAHPYADAAVAKPAGHKKKKKPSGSPDSTEDSLAALEMSDKDLLKNPLCPSPGR
ncbi:hypothetical protein PAPYR_13445 [Paratrimastix pyriformis]|uniref:Uncharacterized protein n=1 Tax=Paratrimastix pyriformis TaxID=342808 RepID=A0ABQ8U3Q5_9EUKA|nr:hypothetical protein PAPYR_13445 [Paratrimastix pyriformis]